MEEDEVRALRAALSVSGSANKDGAGTAWSPFSPGRHRCVSPQENAPGNPRRYAPSEQTVRRFTILLRIYYTDCSKKRDSPKGMVFPSARAP